MKIAAFSTRPDEFAFFDKFGAQYDVELVMLPADPTIDNIHLAEGCEAISIVTKTFITPEMMDAYQKIGVKFISTRTVGFEHIDVDYAETIGMGVGNVGYTPYSVAEYAVMMMIMALRNMKIITTRSVGQDYNLSSCVRGRLLHDCTVGIVGTGKIGATVAQLLTGFGCKMLAYDLWHNPDLAGIVEYVTLDELLEQSDVVTLHAPSTEENFHLMNEEKIGKMKRGAVLVNTARGELVDSQALIAAIEEEHLGGAALDLVEGDRFIYYRDKKGEQLKNHNLAILSSLPNVITTPHMAFYTDHSASDQVENSIRTCKEFVLGL